MTLKICPVLLPWRSLNRFFNTEGPHPALLLIFLSTLSSCYVTRQALHHNQLYNSRRHIAHLLSDPGTPEKTKKRLKRLIHILDYAKKQGLDTSHSYRYYIHLEGDVISYLVSAAEADRLESKTWWFPFAGTVPYLGFFDESERWQESEKLRTDGYDVYETESAAFSGLGWFEDPVFSPMLKGGRTRLASIIFHELVHKTLWVQDHAEFNENLASYLEDHLTKKYLEELGLKKQLKKFLDKKRDLELYKIWLSDLKEALTGLYDQPPPGGRQTLLAKKEELFRSFITEKRPEFKWADYVGDEPWNNARVLASSLYSPDTSRFLKAHQCSGMPDAGQFLERLSQALRQNDEPFEALDSLCQDSDLTKRG